MELNKWEIAISTTHFVAIIISLVIWSTMFLLATFAISPKYFVTFFLIPKYFGQCFSSPISCNFNFFHHQILAPILYHQNSSSFQTKGVAKRLLNHQILVYFTKIMWTKDKLSKCSEKNNEQTKMTRQQMELKHKQQQHFVHLLELITVDK